MPYKGSKVSVARTPGYLPRGQITSDTGDNPWPFSRDPASPNRPPFLPQPPAVRDRVPTQLGSSPFLRPAVPGDALPWGEMRRALNIYYGVPEMRAVMPTIRPRGKTSIQVNRGGYTDPRGGWA